MWWSRRRVRLAAVAGAITVTALLLLTLLPVPQRFSFHGAAIYDPDPNCLGIDTTSGTTVQFSWSAVSPIDFFVVSCSGSQEIYEGNGTQGSGAFVSSGGLYEFGASCPEGPCVPADVSGSFTGPLLPL